MKIKGQKVVVCGAGGFIAGHLVKDLVANGAGSVRAVDVKPLNEWYQTTLGVENLSLNLQDKQNCYQAADPVRCSSWQPTWAAWDSSRIIGLSACSACSSTLTC